MVRQKDLLKRSGLLSSSRDPPKEKGALVARHALFTIA
jgi:hypothetical protein